ncbi:MAG: NAD+ synthase [Phycisphaera sp.]|nr:NAD+ synthase [Phycisphaera sp.]
MKIALAQINPTVGDIAGNSRLIGDSIDSARQARADLVVFPELAVIGYPPKDLLLKPVAIEQSVTAVNQLASRCTDIAAVIGYPCPSDDPRKGLALYNAAAFCAGGRIVKRHIKSLLPTYDVFDESRYFAPAHGQDVDLTEYMSVKLGISICEDLWNDREMFSRTLYHDNPIDRLAAAGATHFVNASASPYVVRKHEFRLKLFAHAARKHKLPLFYCNQVGGNDELVFDGNSCAFDAQGKLIAHAKDFVDDLLVVDTDDHSSNRLETYKTGLESIYHALVLGLRDYCRKCGFKSVVVGLSGGIDSALTAALCVAAMGRENVRGVAMPSRFSSDHSVHDAKELARRLGIPFDIVPISKAHEAFEGVLSGVFAGLTPDTTEENIQARIRGVILMAMSNKFGSLLVTTGNKSELAVGYCTLYGDMAGGLAILSDVPKTTVWELSRWINTDPASPLLGQYQQPVIPESSIEKVPSAELRPNQTDQDSLPPYDMLDEVIERYVEKEQSAREIIEKTGYDAQMVARVVRLIDINEYKRKQAAPGIKVTGRAFGFGRRMPIAQRFDSRGT